MARGLAPVGARVRLGAGDTAGGHLGAGAFRVPLEPDHERSVDIGDPGAGDPGPRGRDCRGWRLSCGEAADHRRERGPDTNADGDVPRAVEAGSAGAYGRGPPLDQGLHAHCLRRRDRGRGRRLRDHALADPVPLFVQLRVGSNAGANSK